jgi:hypothetical protein
MENEQVDKDAILEITTVEELNFRTGEEEEVLKKLNKKSAIIPKSDISKYAKKFKFLVK